jgi:hypothetical protein
MFVALSGFGQNVYFVANNGNNANPGTKAQPFLTIQHGIDQLDAGDTLYIRGGVYYITAGLNVTAGHPHNHSNGTESDPIVVSAYPPDHAEGNVAIVDGINSWRTSNIWIRDISWWKFWGITFRHALQDGDPTPRKGILISRAAHIYFESCVAHNNGGSGFYAEQNGTIAHFINCDSYNNADTLFIEPNIAGGMARGFAASGVYSLEPGEELVFEVYMIGNRAWDNSDNAFEGVYTIGKVRMENNWAIRAGRAPSSAIRGDGRSFVAGLSYNIPPPNDQYIIKNNIAAYGKAWAYNVNSRQRPYQINAQYYNNLDIKCNSGWVVRRAANEDNPEDTDLIFRNNVSYGQLKKMTDQSMVDWEYNTEFAHDYNWLGITFTSDHNTWDDEEMILSEADFVGPIDSLALITAMLAPRKEDGSLPDLPNLWPSENSQLKDAGIDVGLPYFGTAPDLGPFQYDPGETGHILIFQIENETGNAINNASITFNGATRPPGVYTLHGIEEGTYDFSVTAPGYETYTQTGLLVEGDMEIQVVMTPLPAYTISFDVKNTQDNPIGNATITFGTITNPAGNYNFPNILPGTYNYSVVAPGYQTVNVNNYEVDGDATIPVVMTLNNYQINLSASPAAGGSVTGQGTYQHGQTVHISAQVNPGYNFVNWTENGNSVSTNPDYSFTATQNRNLVANFSVQTYTVSLSANPTGAGTLSGAGTYNHNAGVTINAQPNAGHTFVNWTENGNVVSTNPQFTFNINSNRSFTAHFSVNTYEIEASASPSEGGSTTGAGNYSYGETAVLTATSADEYNFTYWRENGNVVSNQPEYSFTVTGNRNLTAHFALDIYEVTLLSLPEEAGDLFGAGNYEPGDFVSINAVAKPGFFFHQWTDEGENVVSQDPLFNFTIEDDRTFTAHFLQETYTLTLTPNPTYGGLTEGAGSTFNYDQEVTVRAIPYSGFKFDAWTESGVEVSSDAIYTFIMEGDRHLTANFSPQEYLIQVTVNPEEGGTVEGAGSYLHGDYVSLDAYPAQDYVFLQWLDNDLIVSESPDYSFIANNDRNLEAVFIHVDELVRIDAHSFPPGYAFIEGAGDYPINRRVTLNAEPVTSDYSFVGWMENGRYIGYENPFLFNATENRNITASFTYEPGELEVAAQLSIPETGHIYGTGNYSRGQVAILQAELHENVSFIGWKNQSGQIVSRQNPYNFEVNRNMDMMAMVELKDGMSDDDFQLKVYPNPSDGRFTVTIREEALITLHNSQGIALETIRVTPEENQLNLGYLPSGVYFLRFQTKDDVLSAKIIIR